MLATKLSLVFGLVTLALTAPSHDQSSRYRKHGHQESGHVSVSGMPYPTGNGTGVTALSGPSFYTIRSTKMITITAPSLTNPIAEPSQSANDKTANVKSTQTAVGVEDKVLAGQASAASDGCSVVTVTNNPTITVTVGTASSSAVLPPASSPVNSVLAAPVQSPASSSAAAEAVSSPPSEPLASSIPPSSSVKVAVSSAAIAATTPSAQAATVSESNAASALISSSAPSASSSTTAPANNAGFRTKRGILASGSGQLALVSGLTPFSKISWLGDWYSGPPTNLPSTMQFVPQNYGKQSDVKGEWTSNAQKAVAAGDKYFLSFGEPGTPNAQLYIDPQDAVTLFMQKMQPYAEQGVTIGAPGTLQNDQDFAWLSSFLDLCDKAGCSIGFLAFHWFWEASQPQNFKDRLTKFITLANGKPVWVDNFQASGTAAAQKQFLQEIVPWLEEQASVQRYAYVPVDPGNGEGFLNDDGKTLSDLGAYYANL